MRHKQCSRHAVHEVLKSKTCLFTYNAKSNLLRMQTKSYHDESRYQDRLIRLAVVIDPGSVIPWKCIRFQARTSRRTVEVPNRLGSQERSNWIQSHLMNAAIRFLLYGFTYYLTLSSECFSTFPHGTCSLSVSLWYLALEQVYVPRWRSNLKLRYSKGVQCTAQTIRDYRTSTFYG